MPNSGRSDLPQPAIMHQFPKPRHNKLSTTAARHKRASQAVEAAKDTNSLSFFAKLSAFGNHSSGHSRRSSDEDMTVTSNGPSMYTPLEWSCKGDELDWDVLPEPSLRPPSLTHSRGSSSDSAVSASSSALDLKPLPALPLFHTPDNKGRPFSVAVLESIDEANSIAISRQNSQELAKTPAQLQFPHLDLAVLNPASSSPLPSPSVTASSTTPKRPASAFTAFSASSPATVWTPRDSTCYTPGLSVEDDSALSPFGLEASLARQELLARASLADEFNSEGDEVIERVDIRDVFAEAQSSKGKSENEGAEESEGTETGPEEEEDFVTPVEEDLDDPSLSAANAVRRATIQNRGSVRLSLSGGGWRGWRTGSQPNTPSSEIPPQLSLQLPCGAVGAVSSGTPSAEVSSASAQMDYFGAAVASRLNSIPEAGPSSPSSPTGSLAPSVVDNTSLSVLPKLSPEFSFGRRSPSPTPSDAVAAAEEATYGTPSALRYSRELPPSQVPMPLHRRSRAASADQLGPQLRALAASAGPSTTPQSLSAMHKNKLALRRAGTAPRLQARSFDAEELNLLRGMSTPKYTWI